MKTTTMLLQIALGITFGLTVFGIGTPSAAGHEKPHVTLSDDVMVLDYHFGKPEIIRKGDFDQVSISGSKRYNKAGAPLIPVKGVQILVPAGMRIEKISCTPLGTFLLPGIYKLEHGTEQFFKSIGPPDTPTPPDPEIYTLTGFWPFERHELVTVQTDRGFEVAHVNFFPLQ